MGPCMVILLIWMGFFFTVTWRIISSHRVGAADSSWERFVFFFSFLVFYHAVDWPLLLLAQSNLASWSTLLCNSMTVCHFLFCFFCSLACSGTFICQKRTALSDKWLWRSSFLSHLVLKTCWRVAFRLFVWTNMLAFENENVDCMQANYVCYYIYKMYVRWNVVINIAISNQWSWNKGNII